MRLLQISIFLVFTFSSLQAQTRVDSLESLLQREPKNVEQRVDILNTLGFEYWIIDSKKSLNYGNQALQLSKEANYKPGIAMANRVLGVALWTISQPKEALEHLDRAHQRYLELDDIEGIANSLLNMGMVYAEISDEDKAMELYNEALAIFQQLQLMDRVATAYTKIGSVLLKQQKFYDAERYFLNALEIHGKKAFAYGVSEAHNRLGKLYIDQGKLELADHHIRLSIINGAEVNDEDGTISNLVLFGKLLRLRKEYELSDGHLRLALSRSREKSLTHHELEALSEMKELKKEQNISDSALHYYDLYLSLKDSLFSSANLKQIAAMEFQSELEERNLQLAYLQERETANKRIKWIIFSALCLTSFLSILLIRNQKIKNRDQKELLESQNKLALIKLENERLKHAELSDTLQDREKELTSYTLNFVQKNEILENLQKLVSEANNSTPDAQKRLLNKISKVLNQHKAIDNDWEDFRLQFEKVHTNFFTFLKGQYPSLSTNDLKVAALCRLNLSIKESARILGISPESAKTARYRLRKKLKLAVEDDLFNHLVSVC